jgi:hypothetical protein
MRLPRKYGYTIYSSYSRSHPDAPRLDVKSWHVEFWHQPLHRWVIARVYNWYDMKVFKVPGFRKLENFLHNRYNRKHPDIETALLYLPIGIRQDIRAFDLNRRQQVRLARVSITKETYDSLSRRRSRSGPAPHL